MNAGAGLMRSPSTGRVGVPFSARFHSARSGRHPDGTPVEGLRMSTAPFTHRPVMLDEVVTALGPAPGGWVLDATVGGGGHAAAVLGAHPHLSVLGLDRDPAAIAAAAAATAEFRGRAVVARARFDRLADVLDGQGITWISGALFDLGVSSPQLDRPERGFSYRADGPLDMRMDPDAPGSAADLVNAAAERELAALFAANGEARFARRIAAAIVRQRPITSTALLAEVVRAAIPAAARRTGGHPATRVFQALRIAVNSELDVLGPALDAAVERLTPGGRIVVLSYHSGEDRIVKTRLRAAATGGCTCPPGLPCVCGAAPTLRLVTRKPLRPSSAEVAINPRAASALLRVAERLETA
ncbi:MAG TPA: 16S rRNA (cytosine(1402)-N(4))-methyltransferase RsmH [Acidimicrobiales bacterium]|nr:16S rRNA (cytosine(1402)-N(4))-methyltransferase RsmH [Acidimicrobiales bacterium]